MATKLVGQPHGMPPTTAQVVVVNPVYSTGGSVQLGAGAPTYNPPVVVAVVSGSNLPPSPWPCNACTIQNEAYATT